MGVASSSLIHKEIARMLIKSLLIFIYLGNLVCAGVIPVVDLTSGVVISDSLDTGDNYHAYEYFKIYIPDSTTNVSVNFTSTGNCALTLLSSFRTGFPCEIADALCTVRTSSQAAPQSSVNETWDLLYPYFAVDTNLYFSLTQTYGNQQVYSFCPFELNVTITSTNFFTYRK